jgi:hypothetical protein
MGRDAARSRRPVVLTTFVDPEAFDDGCLASGEAHRIVARRVALQLLRDARVAREARRGRGCRIGRISVEGDHLHAFDHVVATLRFCPGRSHAARVDARFHLGPTPAGCARVALHLGTPCERRGAHAAT